MISNNTDFLNGSIVILMPACWPYINPSRSAPNASNEGCARPRSPWRVAPH